MAGSILFCIDRVSGFRRRKEITEQPKPARSERVSPGRAGEHFPGELFANACPRRFSSGKPVGNEVFRHICAP